MSYKIFETKPYCVGGRHHSSTLSTQTDVTKTVQQFCNVKCVHCRRKN